MSLVETVMVLTVLLLALSGFLRAMLGATHLNRSNETTAIAMEALRTELERISGEPFAELFVRYNDNPADDPALGTSPGKDFAIAGLDPTPDDPDGLPGEILFPLGAGAGTLSETTGDFPGLPRDLNLDGDAADADVTADHVLLPIVVRARWRDSAGMHTVEFRSLLVER